MLYVTEGRRHRRLSQWLACVALSLLLGAWQPLMAAGLVLPEGASIQTGAGQLDLGCSDADIAGLLAGQVTGAGSVTLAPGGQLDGLSLGLSGDWINQAEPAQSVALDWRDGCGISVSRMLGSTVLPSLSVSTQSGRELQLDSDGEQVISQALVMTGSEDNRLMLRPSTAFQLAEFTLLTGATQAIDFIDGAYIDSGRGQTIAPDRPELFNSVATAGMINWFVGEAIPVPTLPSLMILLLILLIGWLGVFAAFRTSR
ncbi:MAG: hypothetical protein ACXIUL_06545 [Wenzhouxiangella sp.]